jgi:homoserine kinase type II
MAVYTDIAEAELAAFLARYDIGGLLSYKGIAEGTENSNFILHTNGSEGSGSFILTLYEKRVERDDLPFFLGLMEHLAERGVSCPLPVHRRDGEVIGELAGRPAAIITFLEGMWPRRPTAVHCRAVGEALARLHVAGADFALTRPNALSHFVGRLRGPRRRGRAGAGGRGRRRFRRAGGRLAARPAAWRHPCRPFPRQRLLPR